MTTRDDFIAALRDRLRDGIPENPLRPLTEASHGPIAYAVDLSDPIGRFEAAATGAGAEIVGNEDLDLGSLLHRVVREAGASRVAVAQDPACLEIEPMLRSSGIDVVPNDDVGALASAQLGITGAAAGIALTGSVVIDSSQAGSRLVSLLPDTHLVLLSANRIVPTPGDVLRNFTRYPSGELPSNLVFVTGPSRSADIEMQLTIGVHGPRRVLIALR